MIFLEQPEIRLEFNGNTKERK